MTTTMAPGGGPRLVTALPSLGVGVVRRPATGADEGPVLDALECSFLAHLGRVRHLAFLEGSTIAVAPRGAVLYGPTEQLPRVAIVVEGLTRDFARGPDGRDLTVAYGTPGAPVALSSLVRGQEAMLWIQALIPTSVVEIPAELIEAAAADHPAIGFALASQLQALIVEGMEALTVAASASLRGRLAYHLLRLASVSGGREELPIGQRDLADVVGSAREVVSRALRSLREDGLVRTETAHIWIEDEAGLERVARGADVVASTGRRA